MRHDALNDRKERLGAIEGCSFAALCGLETVSVSPGEAVVRMKTDGKRNALGTVHGGAVFTLADQAFALAANADEDIQVALRADVSFLRPATGDLEARAFRISEGKNTSLYEARVYDGEELVAVFHGSGYKLGRQE
jgi:acyl-CoA thioesterase